tara:strand:- start:718 stop:1140 length:423 start_codon:yes stop_codon:yes gene_type:complete
MEAFVYQAKVLRVVDGDTIDVDLDLGFSVWMRKQRVRLYGIDTPESRTRNKEEKVRGLLSKAKLKEMCPTGGTILLRTEVGNEKGKFGRILGKLFTLQGKDINQHLIENNYAVAYHGQSKDDIEAEHLKNAKILSERGEI